MVFEQGYIVTLNDTSYEDIRFGQYSKNYPLYFELDNYVYEEGDIFKIEWIVNDKIVIIQSGVNQVELINDNVLTCKLRREVTLNAGEGYFNIVVENLTDTRRVATFKQHFIVEGNSIDENTVETALVNTVIEEMQTTNNECLDSISKMEELINTGDINNYAKKDFVAENYYNKTEQDSTYLNKVEASDTYLTKESATETYLNKTDALNTYVKLKAGYDLSKNDFSDSLLDKLNSLYLPNTYGYVTKIDLNTINWDYQAYVNNCINTPSKYGFFRCEEGNGHLRQWFETRGSNDIFTRYKVANGEWGKWTKFKMITNPDIPKTWLPDFTCPDTGAYKYTGNGVATHNWYEVKNGWCFVHIDFVTPVPNLNRYTFFGSGLPKPTGEEIWFLATSPSGTIGRFANMVINKNGGLRVDRVTTNGRFMGSVSYPILEE